MTEPRPPIFDLPDDYGADDDTGGEFVLAIIGLSVCAASLVGIVAILFSFSGAV